MTPLAADSFFNDPRIEQARRLVLDALREHQQNLAGPRPADAQLAASYEKTLEQFAKMRGGALFFPYLGSGLGNGALVELADGSVKYDFISGIGVHGWGHSHPLLVEAAFDAALRDTVMQGNLQQNVESVALEELLLRTANQGGAQLAHCFLTTSGAMANENALKLVFQKHSPADRVLAFERCFMGRTLSLAQITDKPAYRAGLPVNMAVDYVPFHDASDPQGGTQRAVAALKAHLARYPGRHAAMCFELVQGEGGYWPGTRDFFAALMDVVKQAGAAVVIDEIQTFGRTTQPFAFQHFGLDAWADIVTAGKMTQVCATLFRDEYTAKPGLISQTFTGSTSSIFASRAIVQGLAAGGFFGPQGRIEQLHQHFAGRLQAIAERHPDAVRGPFGIGAMIAFTPFDGSADKAKRLVRALFDAGVMAFIAGGDPARVRFLMPVGAVTLKDIDAVCAILEQTLVESSCED